MKRVRLLLVMGAFAVFAGVQREEPPKQGKVRSLSIGINEYPPKGWLANAKFAVNDDSRAAV